MSKKGMSFKSAVKRTEQHHKTESDINNIVRKYKAGEVVNYVNTAVGAFRDVSEMEDYQGLRNKMISAEQAFMELPSGIRKRFRNDPTELIKFVGDKKNLDEAIALGLAVKKPDPNASTSSGGQPPAGNTSPGEAKK